MTSTPVDVDSILSASSGDLRRSRRTENFPVALRLLPRARRRDLIALYDVFRTIDDLGDETDGDATAALDRFEAQLRGIWRGAAPGRGVLARLAPTVRAHDLSITPFLHLIEANRRDQVKVRYSSWPDLKAYCALSADPVGRLVLAVFEGATPHRIEMSDRICTALQVLEHCQDVAEDLARGRIYLPTDAMAACGVSVDDLAAPTASPSLQAVVGHLVGRAERMLAAAPELIGSLSGSARLAIAGFAAGGFATADALRRAEFDVLAHEVRPRRRDVVRHAVRLMRAGR